MDTNVIAAMLAVYVGSLVLLAAYSAIATYLLLQTYKSRNELERTLLVYLGRKKKSKSAGIRKAIETITIGKMLEEGEGEEAEEEQAAEEKQEEGSVKIKAVKDLEEAKQLIEKKQTQQIDEGKEKPQEKVKPPEEQEPGKKEGEEEKEEAKMEETSREKSTSNNEEQRKKEQRTSKEKTASKESTVAELLGVPQTEEQESSIESADIKLETDEEEKEEKTPNLAVVEAPKPFVEEEKEEERRKEVIVVDSAVASLLQKGEVDSEVKVIIHGMQELKNALKKLKEELKEKALVE